MKPVRETISKDRRRLALGGGIGIAAMVLLADDAEAQIRNNPTISSFANVLNFGADPTGTKDSTAAFLAAEASFPFGYGGIIFMPPGVYKTNTGIAFQRAGTSLIGSAAPDVNFDSGNSPCYIDATGIPRPGSGTTWAISTPSLAAGNAGVRFEGFGIKMAVQGSGGTNSGDGHSLSNGVSGLNCNSIDGLVIRDISISAGSTGIYIVGCFDVDMSGCRTNNCNGWGLVIRDESLGISVHGCTFENGNWGGNVIIASAFANQYLNPFSPEVPTDVNFSGCYFDESFGYEGNFYIRDGLRITIQDLTMLNANSGGNGSTGPTIKIGGPTGTQNDSISANSAGVDGCRIGNIFIRNYDTTNGDAQTATILIGPNAKDVVIEDSLTTFKSGSGADIIDLGQNTVFRNVNGVSSIPILPPEQQLTISGTPAAGDVITLTFTSITIPTVNTSTKVGGVTASTPTAAYTVQSGDTLTSIAAGLAAAINAVTTLAQANVNATSSSAVVTVVQPGFTGLNTTISATVTHGGGGTEAVAFSPSGGAMTPPVPTTANFVLSQTANKVPVDGYWSPTDSRRYFVDNAGNLRYMSVT